MGNKGPGQELMESLEGGIEHDAGWAKLGGPHEAGY